MTATDKLCKLLDERGAKYDTDDLWNHAQKHDSTSWKCDNGKLANFSEIDYPHMTKLRIYDCTPEQAIAATLDDADYERRMDELLCRLTNGKWSKSRSYSVDFMVSCVDEAYEDATLGGVNPDGLPNGLTISDDGTLLNWRGENYVKQTVRCGKLTAEQVREVVEEHMHDFGNDWQAIADELNTTLGGGECENVAPDYLDFLCSVCGFVHYHSDENDTGNGNDWAYCPRCGKAVKR